jgi:hypothetical protein
MLFDGWENEPWREPKNRREAILTNKEILPAIEDILCV